MQAQSLAALLIFSVPYGAVPQQQSGTIIVFRVTPVEAIVAADSLERETYKGKTVKTHSVCKILVFDNKYIFAASGYSGRHFGRSPWDLSQITKEMYRTGNISSTGDFANLWTSKMHTILIRDYKIFPPPVHEGNTILSAIFIGIKGNEIDARSRIFHSENSGHPSLEAQVITANGEDTAMGEDNIILEFKANKTTRAGQWRERIDMLTPEVRMVALVKLVEEFNHSGGVGGNIDSVRISTLKQVEWLTGKRKCRK
jgi:hypothetical protein